MLTPPVKFKIDLSSPLWATCGQWYSFISNKDELSLFRFIPSRSLGDAVLDDFP